MSTDGRFWVSPEELWKFSEPQERYSHEKGPDLVLVAASYLQADETPVQVHDRRGENHHVYLCQYGKPNGETVFDFCLGRRREGPRKFLGEWDGILQTDGHAAYNDIGGPKLGNVGCWAHARRKFVDAVQGDPQHGVAIVMLANAD